MYFTCEVHNIRFSSLQALKEHDVNFHKEERNEPRHPKRPSSVVKENAYMAYEYNSAKKGLPPKVSTAKTINMPMSMDRVYNIKVNDEVGKRDIKGIPQAQKAVLEVLSSVCGKLIPKETSVTIVKTEEQDEKGTFICHICSDVCLTTAQLTAHLDKHIISTPKENQCRSKFSSLVLQNPDHKDLEHFKEDDQFSSDDSTDTTDSDGNDNDPDFTLSEYAQHKDERRGVFVPSTSRMKQTNKVNNVLKIKRVYHRKGSGMFSNLKRSSKPSIEIDVSSSTSKMRKTNNNIDCPYLPPRVVCYFCGYFPPTKEIVHFVKHMNKHTCERQYSCIICNIMFHDKRQVEEHEETHNFQETTHKCKFCRNLFKSKSILRRHMLTHSNEKPYSCSFCDKSFKRPGCLRKHIGSIHYSEPIIECNECGKSFKRSDVYHAHMKHFHPSTKLEGGDKTSANKRKIRCKLCGQHFELESVYTRHIKLAHSEIKPNKCLNCDEMFGSNNELRIHLKTCTQRGHPGKCGVYTCTICQGKGYSNMTSFKLHLKSFHDMDGFRCHVRGCQGLFSDKNSLDNHKCKKQG